MTLKQKTCTGCNDDLAVSEFRKNSHAKDGLQHRCKMCVRAYRKQHYWANRERILDQERARWERPEYIQRRKRYAEQNREHISAYQKKRSKRLDVKVRNNQWYRDYRKNPSKKLTHSLRVLLNRALKGQHKTNRALGFLGCDIEVFRSYMESLFQEGMTWENYGIKGWHIDHIMPCSRFDLSDPMQQSQCFHYTNMQPLWAEDNMRKFNKLPEELAA